MLSPKVLDALNKQVHMEANASQKYLAMACWCDANSMEGCARFLPPYRRRADAHA